MRLGVCGGVYSNPYALRAFLDDARRRGCERLFCLGDLGGFGAEPDAVWPLLVDNGVECIAGNYDVAIGRGDDECGCGYRDPRDNEYAQLIYDFTKARTSAGFAAWMRTLSTEHRETIEDLDVHFVHGSPLVLNDFFWESLDDDEVRLRVEASGADVLCCTHTGLPWLKRVDGRLVVNVGALGRPANDGSREVWYAILDLEDGQAEAELVPLAYDWQAHAASMRAAGLPEPFVETVETGWWTTCLEVVPPLERSRGRYQLYRSAVPQGFAADGVGWADPPELVDDGLPVVPLFGSPLFPPRLWVYTNFHCNLRCVYCSVASSPTARRRSMAPERFRSLVDEAVAEGFAEIYVTGGEPFLEPDIVDMIAYASDRLDTVVLTNAMLFKGRQLSELRRLAGRDRLVLQTSIDGARAETHDRNRGPGSWARAMEGLALGRELGLPMRVGLTETPDNASEVPELAALLAGLGIVGRDFAVRPLIKRGFSETGISVDDTNTVPELAVSTDGVHWHPAGADVDTSPDMLLAAGEVPLAEAKRLVVERFLRLRQGDGSLPLVYNCAV
ncbi:MAG: metallophosphoesterase family protein [Actinobacteria bacterium]|nr:metallophosphoesterase family protein [Actinomycetota bacterium]